LTLIGRTLCSFQASALCSYSLARGPSSPESRRDFRRLGIGARLLFFTFLGVFRFFFFVLWRLPPFRPWSARSHLSSSRWSGPSKPNLPLFKSAFFLSKLANLLSPFPLPFSSAILPACPCFCLGENRFSRYSSGSPRVAGLRLPPSLSCVYRAVRPPSFLLPFFLGTHRRSWSRGSVLCEAA